MSMFRMNLEIAHEHYDPNGMYPPLLNNVTSIQELHGLIKETPYHDIHLAGIETAANICDIGKIDIEHDNITRRSRILSKSETSSSVTQYLGKAYYHKGKEADAVVLLSDFIHFQNKNSELNQYMTKEEL